MQEGSDCACVKQSQACCCRSLWKALPVQGSIAALVPYVHPTFTVIMSAQPACYRRCLDLSKDRSSLALVDERSCLHVYEAGSGTLLWSVEGATSAAWNSRLDGMLAWSEAEMLYTKTADHPVQCHPLLIQVSPGKHPVLPCSDLSL